MTVAGWVLQLVSAWLMWRYHHTYSALAEDRGNNRSETETFVHSS